uniref:Reelin domain-containing protein n=1 Tax=Angiostrongylus cantonensis TaxID=6313 RepID=A0A0K0DDK4_ANGCA
MRWAGQAMRMNDNRCPRTANDYIARDFKRASPDGQGFNEYPKKGYVAQEPPRASTTYLATTPHDGKKWKVFWLLISLDEQ